METHNNDVNPMPPPTSHDFKSFALSGKIMLIAIIVLLIVVVLMVNLHLYVRWYLLRARRRRFLRYRRRSPRLVLYAASQNGVVAGNSVTVTALTHARGLDVSVLKSLPVFVYSEKTHPESVDCSVCLSELEEGETGRVLPNCKHSFHTECIDLWFSSHSTCPLCRSPVEPAAGSVAEPGSGSGCAVEASPSSSSQTSSFGQAEEQESDTSATQSFSFRSPMSRVMSLSFKRILSRDNKRGSVSFSGNVVTSESDIEKGQNELTQ